LIEDPNLWSILTQLCNLHIQYVKWSTAHYLDQLRKESHISTKKTVTWRVCRAAKRKPDFPSLTALLEFDQITNKCRMRKQTLIILRHQKTGDCQWIDPTMTIVFHRAFNVLGMNKCLTFLMCQINFQMSHVILTRKWGVATLPLSEASWEWTKWSPVEIRPLSDSSTSPTETAHLNVTMYY
jgi:hypothetical protein